MGPGHRVTKRVRAETVVASTIPQSQPVMPSQEFVQDIQPIKKRTRGPSRGKKTDDIVQLSGKIKLHISPETNRPVGHKYSSMLSSECGYLVRRFAPLQHEKWSKIPESEKQVLFDQLLDQMVEIQQQQQTDPEEAKPLTQREICIEVLGKKSGYFRGLGNGPRPTSNHGVDTSEADRLHGIISSQQSRLDSQDVELQEQKKTIDQLESRLSQFEGMMQQFFSSQGSAFRFTDSATQ